MESEWLDADAAASSLQITRATLYKLIRQGRLRPEEIITHRMPLSEGVRGYEIFDAHEDDVLKVVLEP